MRVFGFCVALCALALIWGCDPVKEDAASKNKETISAAEAQAKSKADEMVSTFRSEDGKTAVSNAGPTAAQIGVPYYPASTPIEKGGMITGSPEARMYHSKRTSNDTPETIIKWYTKNVKGLIAEGNILTYGVGTAKSGTIKVEAQPGKGTLISITAIETKS